jgi:hypothetical protein
MIKEESEKEISMKHIAFYQMHAGFLLGLFFDPEDGGAMLLQYISGLHSVISQKMDLFITTAVRPSHASTEM